MVNPSGMRLRTGQTFKVEEVDNGLFSVENAYEGEYEYFENRPITLEVKDFKDAEKSPLGS